jgi:hypothetical protein
MANFEVGVALLIVAVYYFYYCIIRDMTEEMFSVHGGIKIAFMIGFAWMMLFPLNIAMEFNDANTGAADVTTNIAWMYQAFVWANYALTAYLVIYLIVNLLRKAQGGKDGQE